MTAQLEFGHDARYALSMANVEAGKLHHEYVGTEHMLLGLLHKEAGSVVAALDRLGVTPSVLRDSITALVKAGTGCTETEELRPFTSRCKTVITEAGREATEHEHASITAGDLLVGLFREGNGVAGQVLTHAGLDAQYVRSALQEVESAT